MSNTQCAEAATVIYDILMMSSWLAVLGVGFGLLAILTIVLVPKKR